MAWWKRSEFGILAASLASLAAGAGRGGLWGSEQSGAVGIRLAESSEALARAPGVAAAVGAALLLAWAVARAADARAGAWAGVAYATLPLVFVNARLACGAWAAQSAGTAVFALGAAALWGRGGRGMRAALWCALAVAAGASMRAGGPAAGAAAAALLGCALAVGARWRAEGLAERWLGALSGAAGLGSGVCWERSLGGAALSGGSAGFDALAEHLAHGAFFWAPLVLLGAGRLVLGAPGGDGEGACEAARSARAREEGLRAAALGALALAYAGQTWAAQRVGVRAFAAPAALAIAAGLFVRDFERGGRAWRMAAGAAVLGAAVVTRDVLVFPRALLAAAPSCSTEVPRDAGALGGWLAAAGVVFALGAAGALSGASLAARAGRWARRFIRRRSRAGWLPRSNAGAVLLPGAAVMAAGLLMHGYLPALSDRVSAGPAWRALARVRRAGDEVAVLGAGGDALGTRFYAGGPVRAMASAEQAVEFLRDPPAGARRFVVAGAGELAGLNRAFRARSGRNVALVPAGASGALLAVSGGAGLATGNPLDAVVARAAEPAQGEGAGAGAVFDEALQLEGTDVVPNTRLVRAGGVFELTLRFRVLRAVRGDWRTFVHVDGPCARINADHDGAGGLYPIADWLPGDRVLDRLRVEVPWHCGAGEYTVYVGFFRGETRMRVRGGENDGNDRAVAARVRVR